MARRRKKTISPEAQAARDAELEACRAHFTASMGGSRPLSKPAAPSPAAPAQPQAARPAPGAPRSLSLGEAAAREGEKVAVVTKAGMRVRYENAQCTCGGENQNCCRCDGTGYYQREVVESYVRPPSASSVAPHVRYTSAGQEVSFSKDSRGGTYGIREYGGRFESNPLADDYNN